MNTPKVSIILPIFNVELYLKTSLNSLLNQTLSDIEIIAVNDGSTDKSPNILDLIAKQDSRIIVLSQENRGLPAARNLGLKHAKGRWIAFVDSDDWLAPTALESWSNQAEQENLNFLIGNGFRFSEKPNIQYLNSTPILKNQLLGKIVNGEEWIINSVNNNEWPHYVWLQLIDRYFIESNNIYFQEDIVHEDIIWTTTLALKADRVGFYPEAFYGYRFNPYSITSSPSQKAIILRAQSYIIVLEHIIAIANKCESSKTRKALMHQVNREAGHFLGLIRRKINNPKTRKDLCQEFINLKILNSMLKGSKNINDVWRTIRCGTVLLKNLL
jgi:glycosyltransferase involved in cell wall biosynthesis